MEQPPTRKKVSETPPAYTEDPKEIKRTAWAIDGSVPVAIATNGRWIKTKNLKRDVEDGFSIQGGKDGVNKILFIDNYEEAAQMYRERAAKYNKGTY